MRKLTRSVREFFSTRTVLTIIVTLVIGVLVGSMLGSLQSVQKALFGTAFPPPPGGYTCFPTCETNDGKFLSMPGENMDSFADMKSVFWLTVPGDYTSIEIGFFDGDSGKDGTGAINRDGGYWDTTTTETVYRLYADPAKNGQGTQMVAEWLGNRDMPDNAWFNATINVAPEALGPTGFYYYRLECSRPSEGQGINAFKVRSNAYLSTGMAHLVNSSFAIVGSLAVANDVPVLYPQFSGDYNNLGPSTYNGEWSFPLYVPSDQVTIEFWDGDFDRGKSPDDLSADTDDPDTIGRPAWAGANAHDEGAYGAGAPPDDYSTAVFRREPPVYYEILDPSGNPVYTNNSPSGTSEWEKFTISTLPNIQADLQASSLPRGIYSVHIVGLDLSNTVWFRTEYEICPPQGCPPPPCPICEPCEDCSAPTPTPLPPPPTVEPTATPIPVVPLCPSPSPVDLLYVLDTSGSMRFPYPGSGTKLDAAKQAIFTLNNWVSQLNNGSRVGLITFHGAGQGQGYPPLYPPEIQVVSGFTSDINAFNGIVQGVQASGSTPTAETLNTVASWLPANRDPGRVPLVILLSDGVPTVDLERFGFQDEHVQKVNIYDGGNPRSPEEVRGMGRRYDSYNQRAGETLADAMVAAQNLKGTVPEVLLYTVAIQSEQNGIFNDQILRYIASVSGGEFSTAADAAQLAAALQYAFVDSLCEGGGPPPPPPPPGPTATPAGVNCADFVLVSRQKTAPRQITIQLSNNSGQNAQITNVHVNNWPSGWGNWDWVKVIGEQFNVGAGSGPADKGVNKTLGAGQTNPLIFKFANPLNDDPTFSGYIQLDNGCQINF